MADKIDMFKLVEEVEKQKTMNIDDIFQTLDSVKDGQTISSEKKTTYTSSSAKNNNVIKKPNLPEEFGQFDTRFEAFRGIIEHVDYGNNIENSYVVGHKDALEKYYKDAYNNTKDLYVIEARVNDEINKYRNSGQLYDKGYYDGLFYALKALKKSKELLMNRINREIIKNL